MSDNTVPSEELGWRRGWRVGAPAHPDVEGPGCVARRDGYVCTLYSGHPLPHVGSGTLRIQALWDDDHFEDGLPNILEMESLVQEAESRETRTFVSEGTVGVPSYDEGGNPVEVQAKVLVNLWPDGTATATLKLNPDDRWSRWSAPVELKEES